MTNADPVLVLEDVAVHYAPRNVLFGRQGPSVKAVDRVSLSIGSGETLALVGEGGGGKPPLSTVVVGFVPAPRGSAGAGGTELSGADASTLPQARRYVQMIFQDPALSLNPRMT